MASNEFKEIEERMKKQINGYERELAGIRVGRASATLLERITVEYYGTPTPINQMAEVKAVDARTLVVSPWDASTLKAVEKAIYASDLGIAPSNDGKSIRLAFPPLNEDRRKELVKQTAKMGEEAKVHVRNIRRDELERFKKMEKKSEITEDDLKDMTKKLQDITDKYIKEIDAVTAKKDKDIMEI